MGYVAEADLPKLYAAAAVFVYPSLYEGFGIPVLEAFSSGCPVIASNVTSIPEVGGDAVLYFDPLDRRDIISVLMRLLGDSALRRKLTISGYARAMKFTWSETAKKTLVAYRECVSKEKL